ncbi:hypothetical protein EJ04DRAFT_228668 [Polyplosphaeria fusca]|uniref:Uncharacterized protein n=1 Tax=Polyplosphaeria fusca TaxID=682080 RepID=A0A9P4R0F6_9PLEO|nr:hypothetical protein EJ04DRAFT_228668 [Polyplosphaeria fusca]
MSTHPLSSFDTLGPNTLLYTPQDWALEANAPLILFFSWMSAAAKYIAKYTAMYHKLFPHSRILLVRANLADMFRSSAAFEQSRKPAFDIVREHVKGGGEVLLHSSSNGGGKMVVEFMKMWKRLEGGVLPIRAQVLDSSPGRGGWRRSHAAIVMSLPKSTLWRWFGSIGVHCFLLGMAISDKVARRENAMITMCRRLNDAGLFYRKAPRVYVYSRADVMVGDDEVEQHADEAAEKGWVVKKVRFEKSPHAGHIMEDEGRYWESIMEAWNKGARA